MSDRMRGWLGRQYQAVMMRLRRGGRRAVRALGRGAERHVPGHLRARAGRLRDFVHEAAERLLLRDPLRPEVEAMEPRVLLSGLTLQGFEQPEVQPAYVIPFEAGEAGVSTLPLQLAAAAPSMGSTVTAYEGSAFDLPLVPGSGAVDRWAIDWGDGSVSVVDGDGPAPSHTYPDGDAVYTVHAKAIIGGEGKTPGYWKQSHHFDDWVGFSPTWQFAPGDSYEAVFGVDVPGSSPSLVGALKTGGGGYKALLRHSTAALLNASHPGIAYAYAPSEVIAMTQAAFASGNYNQVKDLFENENEHEADLGDDEGLTQTFTVNVLNVAPTLTVEAPASVSEAQSFSLNLASFDPGQDTIRQWTIDWGDGSVPEVFEGALPTPSHAYADGTATYTITATATDDDGTFAAVPIDVLVNNVSPVLEIDGPSSIDEGDAYVLSLAAFDPGDDAITSWTIDWGDGVVETLAGDPSSAVHTYADGDADLTIRAWATDDDGTWLASPLDVTVQNVAPVLEIDGPASIEEGDAYVLSLAAFDPGDDAITSWTIDWGDGIVETLAGDLSSATHTYADGDANLTILAWATDDDGTWQAGPLDVTVQNVAPVLEIDGPSSIEEGDAYVLALAAFDPGDDAITSWTIDWGDGIVETLAGDPSSATHTYADGDADMTIRAWATDDDGTWQAGPLDVTVQNVAPVLEIDGPSSIDEGDAYVLSLAAFDPGDDAITSWTIDWGDGVVETLAGDPSSAVHTYADGDANLTIRAWATDDDGTWQAGPLDVTVQNVAPVLEIDGPSSIDEGDAYVLSLAAFDPGDDAITSWTIDWGDGVVETLAGDPGTAAHVFEEGPATPLIRAWATDEDGTWVANEVLVEVIDAAILLVEGESFRAAHTYELVVPAGAAAVRLEFSDLNFDMSDGDAINDAFELALLDADGRPLVGTLSQTRDAFFNVTEGMDAVHGAGAALLPGEAGDDACVVIVDISHLAAGSSARLVARLINNDNDDATQVRLSSEPEFLASSPIDGASTATPATAEASAGGVDDSGLVDITAAIDFDFGRTTFDEDGHLLQADLTLTHAGGYTIRGPIVLGLRYADDPAVRLFRPDGVTSGGVAYYSLGDRLGGDELLLPGESIADVTLALRNPGRERFDYELVVLGRLNAAPEFVSEPITEVVAGGVYDYDALAEDADSDELRYRLLAGPAGMTIDEVTGAVAWETTGDDLGNHPVSIAVRDGYGGESVQRFNVAVVDVPNRPPVFVSMPVVDANIGGEYVYDSDATDPDQDALVYALVEGPEGMTIDTMTGVLTWSPTVEQLGSQSVTIEAADGRGGIATQTYSILVQQAIGNRAPIIVSEPVVHFALPGTYNEATGVVVPGGIDLDLTPGQSVSQTVQITLPTAQGGGYTPPIGVDGELTVFNEAAPLALANALVAGGAAGIAVRSVSLQGHVGGYGMFDYEPNLTSTGIFVNDSGQFGLDPFGIVISSGGVETYGSKAFNETDGWTGDYFVEATAAQEALLQPITDQPWHFDVTQLDITFDMLPGFDTVFFNVVFGSEEWPEWINQYVDGFGLFVNGQNIAFTEGDNLPINIDHPDMTYIPGTELDAVLAPNGNPVMTFGIEVGENSVDNVLTLIIADANDSALDTVAYISGLGGASPLPRDIEVVASVDGVPLVNNTGIIEEIRPGDTATFDVTLTGDGQALAYDLLFVDAVTGEILGTLPVTINNDYADAVEAIDPDGDAVTYSLVSGPAGAAVDPATGQIVWEPEAAGEFQFVVRAADDRGGIDEQAFTVVVTEGIENTAPVIDSEAPADAHVGRTFVYDVVASDADGDDLSFYLTQAPAHMSIDADSGHLQWTAIPGQEGEHEITVQVFDGRGGSATQTFTVDVTTDIFTNTAPEIVSSPPAGIETGELYTYQLSATDANADLLRYTLAVGPEGMAIDAASGLLVWQPGADQAGLHDVIVVVRDGEGGVDIQGFELQVGQANEAPLFTSAPEEGALTGLAYSYQARAVDPDGDGLTYSLEEAPEGMTIDSVTGLVSWTPSLADAGEHLVILAVEDGRGGRATQGFLLPVTIASVSQPPAINSQPLGPALADRPYAYQVVAADPDGDPVTFALDEAPEGMAIDAQSGLLTWTPGAELVGTEQPVVIRVSDGRGAATTQSFSLPVAADVADNNAAPVITSEPSGGPSIGRTFRYAVVASDANGDSLIYTLTEAPEGMMIDAASGVLTWTPGSGQLGLHDVVIEVTDGRAIASQSFSLEIVPDANNAAPSIASAPTGPATVEHPYQYQVVASDADGDALSYHIAEGPAGLSIDAQSGLLSWTPAMVDMGSHLIALEVRDGRGGITSQSFTLAVDDTTANTAPHIDSQPLGPAIANHAYQYFVLAGDANGDPLTYALDVAPEGMAIDAATGVLTWTPSVAAAGASHDVVIRVSDGRDGFATQSFALGVVDDLPVNNDAPVIDSIPGNAPSAGRTYRYQIIAHDPNGDALTYALAQGPAGMMIDAATGLLTWTPEAAQVGDHSVLVEVTDGHATAGQSFVLSLVADAGNAAPVIVSEPAGPAAVGKLYTYQLRATDADGDLLTMTLDAGPAGMTITANAQGALIAWTPAADQAGEHAVTLRVTDSRGGATLQTFTLPAHQPIDNQAPAIVSVPRTTVALGAAYFYAVTVQDPDGDAVSLSLDAAPAGVSLVDGVITWAPTAADLGEHSIRLVATDSRGASVVQPFTLTVTQQGANQAPAITSSPGTSGTAGHGYTYQVTATDADHDALFFVLTQGPAGMVVDAETGLLAWAPGTLDVGDHPITVTASDPYGATSTQTFTLTIRGGNLPPIITSTAKSQAVADALYRYQVAAADPDGPASDLLFTLLSAPDDMVIHPQTGLIEWVPTAGDIGPAEIVLQVRDDRGGSTTQSYTLVVATVAPNARPAITSDPTYLTALGQTYSYQIVGFDADVPAGDSLTYSLISGPGGDASVDPVTGLLTWHPTAAGVYPFSVAVFDAAGAGSIQSYSVTVRDNNAPTITSDAPAELAAGATLRYDVVATDAELDAITFELLAGPAGMTLDASGRLTWASSPDDLALGEVAVSLRAVDSFGAGDVQDFTITLTPDAAAPQVLVTASAAAPAIGNVVTLAITAYDDVALDTAAGLTLTVNGEALAISADGTATFIPEAAGPVTIVATAADLAGNVGSDTLTLFVVDPSDVQAPTVAITSPAPSGSSAAVITAPTDIVGTAADDNLLEYVIELRRVDDPAGVWQHVHTGSESVTNGVLGRLDPTLLANGTYLLRITATDLNGRTSTDSQVIEIDGRLKLGNFRLGFNDLSLPIGGLPITLTRTYDTLNADAVGDFGHGWNLDLFDMNVSVDLDPADPYLTAYNAELAALGLDSSQAFRDGTRLHITLPDGTRESFTVIPEALGGLGGGFLSGLLSLYRMRIVPDAGVTSTLEFSVNPQVIRNEYGEYTTSGVPFNPASDYLSIDYILTLEDGTRFILDGNTGNLQSITDRQGSRLEIDAAGIRSITPAGTVASEVAFTRDHLSRITAITDPAGATIEYAYDAAGDLVGVTDRAGDTTAMSYTTVGSGASARDHILDTITDARGVAVMDLDYDPATRRIISLADASGEAIPFTYEMNLPPGLHGERLADALGNPTELIRDDRGNLVRQVQRLTQGATPAEDVYIVTVYEYDGRDNQTRQSAPFEVVGIDSIYTAQPAVWTSTSTYDGAGNVLTQTDAMGHTTRYTYDRFGVLESTVDPSGNKVTYVNDIDAGTTIFRDKFGNEATFRYNDAGLLTSRTNIIGETVYSATYHSDGRIATETDAYGETTHYVYTPTADGELRETWRTLGEGRAISRSFFDAADRLVRTEAVEEDADGQVQVLWYTTNEYDSSGRLIKHRDQFGRQYRNTYDAAGRLVEARTEARHPDGTLQPLIVRSVYDANGRVTYETNPYFETDGTSSGNRFFYDALGRATATERLAQLQIAIVTEDGIERSEVVASGDVLSRQVSRFDASGRLIESELDGLSARNLYNRAGRLIEQREQRRDASGGVQWFVTRTAYDALGRPIAQAGPYFEADAAPIHGALTRYDERGEISRQLKVVGIEIEIVAEGAGWVSRLAAPGIQVSATSTERNSTGAVVRTVDRYGSVTEITRDRDGREIERRTEALNADGTSTWLITRTYYSPDGRETITTLPYHESDSSVAGIRTVFDERNRPILSEQRSGVRIDIAADSSEPESILTDAGIVVSSAPTDYNAHGRILHERDADGFRVAYEYDIYGRRTAVLYDPIFDSSSGELVRYRAETEYDGDRVIARRSNVKQRLDGSVDRSSAMEVRFAYDALGREIARYNSDGTFQLANFDAAGHLASVSDSLGRVTSYEYDNQGRLTAVILPAVIDPTIPDAAAHPRYEYAYDALGNRSLVRTNIRQLPDGSIDASEAKVTQYIYNTQQLLVQQILPDGLSETRSYDERGKISQIVGFDGDVVQYVFDERNDGDGRLLAERYYTSEAALASGAAPDEVVTYTYDSRGRKVQESAGNGVTTFAYDDLGRLMASEAPEGGLHYEYDPQTGRVTRITTTEAGDASVIVSDMRYTYDLQGRLLTSEVESGGSLATAEYTYTPSGLVDQVRMGAGITTDYDYDEAGRLEHVAHYAPDETPATLADNDLVASFDYIIDSFGAREAAIETVLEADGAYSSTYIDWEYDALGRLIAEHVGPGEEGSGTFSPERSTLYTFDLVGNRLSRTTDLDGDSVADEHVTYTYDANDRLILEDGRIADGVTTTIAYTYGVGTDGGTRLTGEQHISAADGILLRQVDYDYGLRGLLTATTVEDIVTGHVSDVAFTYDALRNRVGRKEVTTVGMEPTAPVSTEYLISRVTPGGLPAILEERSDAAGQPVRTYLMTDRVLAQIDGETRYLLTDGRRSTRAVVDANGAVEARYSFDAYGQRTSGETEGDTVTNHLFTGAYRDATLQQDYLVHRYYGPTNGRLTSMDPFIGDPTSPLTLHKYAYAGNSPVNLFDPDGRMFIAFDGTNNHELPSNADGTPNYVTNVYRLFQAATDIRRGYLRGVGNSIDYPGAIAPGPTTLTGGAFGWGGRMILRRGLATASRFLAFGDRELDIVGFSRGAALALEFTHMVAHALPEVTINFVGIFDVVGSFGVEGTGSGITDFRHSLGKAGSGYNPNYILALSGNVQNASHAIAFHEDRKYFPATNIIGAHQVAFRGVHSDIGGGFKEAGLSDVALQWMLTEARSADIAFNGMWAGATGDPMMKPHANDSKWGWPWYGGFVPKGFDRPTIQVGWYAPRPLGSFSAYVDFSRVENDPDTLQRRQLGGLTYHEFMFLDATIAESAFLIALLGVV